MSKVDYKVSVLVEKIARQELQLPEMQRKYVWTATKVRDLLDSLYRGYPSGVILAWEPAGNVQTADFAVATEPGGMKPLLLLDGQQRLTSLSAVLRGEPVHVKGRVRPVEILFNLDHPDELTFITEVGEGSESDNDADEPDEAEDDLLTRVSRRAFVVASNQVLALPSWIKVTDVFKKEEGEILQQVGLTGFDDPRYGKYTARLKALKGIKDYEYRVDVLESTKSYEEVTEIFVRVNSLGAKLRSSDLALAQITAKWNGSLAKFTEYQREVASRGFDLDLSIHLKTLVSLVTGQSRFLTVGSLTRVQLEDGWKRAQRALNFAVDFAKSNLHIDSPTLLSSPFLLIALAYWSDQRKFRIGQADDRDFSQWFLIANAKGRYSRGSSETLLDQDLAVLRDGGGAEELIQRLVQQVGRLAFTSADLVGRTARSGAFKTIFLAFRANGARDWTTKLQISPKHADRADKIEFHHIFPKAYMRNARADLDARLIDDIANLAFIGAKTNKEITHHSPKQYAAWFAEDLFKTQLIEFPDGANDADGYEAFIENRRRMLAEEINKFLRLNEIQER